MNRRGREEAEDQVIRSPPGAHHLMPFRVLRVVRPTSGACIGFFQSGDIELHHLHHRFHHCLHLPRIFITDQLHEPARYDLPRQPERIVDPTTLGRGPSRKRTGTSSARGMIRPLDPERTTKSPGGIVGLRTVVIDEDSSVSAVAEDGTTESSYVRRCQQPARCLRIELPKFL